MRTRLRRITIGSYIFMAYITLLWSLIVIFALCYSDLAQGEDLLSGADWCFGLMPVVLWAAIIFAFLRIRTFTFDEAGFTVSYPLLFVRKRIAAEEIGCIEVFVKFCGKGLSFAYRVIHINLAGQRPENIMYEGENETYIEASVENSSSILYDKEIRNKPRTRRTKRNV